MQIPWQISFENAESSEAAFWECDHGSLPMFGDNGSLTWRL